MRYHDAMEAMMTRAEKLVVESFVHGRRESSKGASPQIGWMRAIFNRHPRDIEAQLMILDTFRPGQ